MEDKKTDKKNEMQIKKENEDFSNLPKSSSHKSSELLTKKDIKKASELNGEGKTDNTEQNKI